MKFKIEQKLIDKISFPYTVAFVVATDLVEKTGTLDVLKSETEAILEPRIRERFSSSDEIVKDKVVSMYADSYKLLGLPDNSQVSIASMYELIGVKKKSLFMNNAIIDFYNSFVLGRGVPAGAYDLDRVAGDIELRFSAEGDKFKQLGKIEYQPVSDTVVMADEREVLCNDWVSKQSETQKVRTTTKNVLFRLEGLGLDTEQMKLEVQHFTEKLEKLFKHSGLQVVFLNSENLEEEIDLSKKVEERRERYLDYTDLLTRGVADVIVYDDLLAKLIDGKKLRIKHGVDPTTKDLHLGYAVNYLKMRQFQDRGHTVVFLIGSFTARFGDPTDKGESRQMKEKKYVLEMAKNYIKQVKRILDPKRLEVRYNGDWLDKMSAEDLLRLMSEFTVARMLERDMFQKRMKDGKEIGLHEIVYPVLQGYDSVELESDVTVIGTDQTFNELQARPLQSRAGQDPQNIIAMELLVGTDGKMKMSQSLGNYIGFDDTPEDKFGKIMSIPDHLILKYFEVCTVLNWQEIDEIRNQLKDGVNPRDLKLRLAHEIVCMYDGEKAAEKAREHFETVFQKKEIPDEMPTYVMSQDQVTLVEALVGSKTVASNSEVRRLVDQGAVKVNGEKVDKFDMVLEFRQEYIVQVGKRKFLRVE